MKSFSWFFFIFGVEKTNNQFLALVVKSRYQAFLVFFSFASFLYFLPNISSWIAVDRKRRFLTCFLRFQSIAKKKILFVFSLNFFQLLRFFSTQFFLVFNFCFLKLTFSPANILKGETLVKLILWKHYPRK